MQAATAIPKYCAAAVKEEVLAPEGVSDEPG
jgi:hypothetical protein